MDSAPFSIITAERAVLSNNTIFFKLYFLERVRGEREIDLPSAGGQLGLI